MISNTKKLSLIVLVAMCLLSSATFAQNRSMSPQAPQTRDPALIKRNAAALKACRLDCKKDEKDAEKYETCMIQCNRQYPEEARRYHKYSNR